MASSVSLLPGIDSGTFTPLAGATPATVSTPTVQSPKGRAPGRTRSSKAYAEGSWRSQPCTQARTATTMDGRFRATVSLGKATTFVLQKRNTGCNRDQEARRKTSGGDDPGGRGWLHLG